MLHPSRESAAKEAGMRRRALFLSSTAIVALLAASPDRATAQATAEATIINEDTSLSAESNPHSGIQVVDGANLSGNHLVIDQSNNNRGVQVISGTADLFGGEIAQSGTAKYVVGVEVQDGYANVRNMTIDIDGVKDAGGLYANGMNAEIVGENLDISVRAAESTTAEPAAGVKGRQGVIRTSNSTISVEGDTAFGLLASGSGRDATVYSTDDTVTTTGNTGIGAFAFSDSGGVGVGTIEIEGSSITTTGAQAHGLYAQGVNAYIETRDGVDVTTHGDQAHAAFAYEGSMYLLDTSLAANGEGARGLTVGKDSFVVVEGGSVSANGANADGVRVSAGGTFLGQDTQINAADGAGIRVNNSGLVGLASTTIRSAGSTLRAHFSTPAPLSTGFIDLEEEYEPIADYDIGFILEDGVVATENNGRLLEVTRSADGADGKAALLLAAGSVTSGDIVDEGPVSETGGTDVVVMEGASWTGKVRGVRYFYSMAGGAADFDDGTEIAGDVVGQGTAYTFGDLGASIGGNVILSEGSSTTGGSIADRIVVAGDVAVDEESVLGGNWAIAGNLANFGRVAPGNSIGRISVDGDLTLGEDSVLDMEIGGDDRDLIEVGGTATLDGLVRVTPLVGAQVRTPYSIVEADGGISGTFTEGVEFAEPLPFVEAALDYDPNAAFVTFQRSDVAFASAAETANQRAAAGALDSITDGASPLVSAIAFTTEAEAAQAFDRLSGEIHASTMAALVEDSDHLRNAAINRLRAASDGVGAAGMPMMAFAPHSEGDAVTAREGVTIWGGGFGSWTDLDGSGGTADISTTTGGFVLGADTAVSDWRLGLMAGFSETDIDGSSASATSTNLHLGAYAGAEWGAVAFRAGLAHSWHDIEVDRSVVAGTLSERLESDYDAETFQAFAELGYRIDGERVRLEPFVNLAYVDFDGDGYNEGDGVAALSGDGGSMETTLTTLGLRASTDVDFGGLNDAVLSGMVGWRHAFGDTGPSLSHAFAAGDSFGVKGTEIAEDALLLEAGLSYDLSETARFGIATNGQFGSGVEEFGLSAQVGIRF